MKTNEKPHLLTKFNNWHRRTRDKFMLLNLKSIEFCSKNLPNGSFFIRINTTNTIREREFCETPRKLKSTINLEFNCNGHLGVCKLGTDGKLCQTYHNFAFES